MQTTAHVPKTTVAPATTTSAEPLALSQVDNRASTVQARGLLDALAGSPRQVAQRAAVASIADSPRQVAQRAVPSPNRTGLPDNLKAGVESLSGHSLDDVRVHYNSAKPAHLQAHAYAQGTEIHLAPGQEKHLPHEAWHVAQQKQGRVKATRQLKGIGLNDDGGLEKEAEVMGARALGARNDAPAETAGRNPLPVATHSPVQRVVAMEGDENFEAIFTNFCIFAKRQNAEAWQMLSWFWHGENNVLNVVSTPELKSLGFADVRINNKPAHTLTDDEWRLLPPDAPAEAIVSIKKTTDEVKGNDTSQYYTILHELMVHTYPFYVKIKSVREGKGPKTRAEAGYADGPDAMGAHAEHQALLHKNNPGFYGLYNFMLSDLLKWEIGQTLPEALAGFRSVEFMDAHERDLMIQYVEEPTAMLAGITAKVNELITEIGLTSKSSALSVPDKKKVLERIRRDFINLNERVREIGKAYKKAAKVHDVNYVPKHARGAAAATVAGPDGIPVALPYVNPDSWGVNTIAQLSKLIKNAEETYAHLERYVAQLESAINKT